MDGPRSKRSSQSPWRGFSANGPHLVRLSVRWCGTVLQLDALDEAALAVKVLHPACISREESVLRACIEQRHSQDAQKACALLMQALEKY